MSRPTKEQQQLITETKNFQPRFWTEFGKLKLTSLLLTVPASLISGLCWLLYNPQLLVWKMITGMAVLFILTNIGAAFILRAIYNKDKDAYLTDCPKWRYVVVEIACLFLSAIPLIYYLSQ